MELQIKTVQPRQVVDITDQVQVKIESGAKAINVFAAHTTCAITTADLDPGTDKDLIDALAAIIPKLNYRHPHDSSHQHVMSHLASSIIGPAVTIPINDGRLTLGEWQRVVLIELDGPRSRSIYITNL